jgi:hypothetical protein
VQTSESIVARHHRCDTGSSGSFPTNSVPKIEAGSGAPPGRKKVVQFSSEIVIEHECEVGGTGEQ